MARRLAPCLVGVAILTSCARPEIVPDARVAVRSRSGSSDSALIVVHDTSICSVTLRDESGALRDHERVGLDMVAIDLTRDLARTPVPRSSLSRKKWLFTPIALPSGRYRVDAYLDADEHGTCNGELPERPVRLPFRIETGEVTLLSLPHGRTDFVALRRLRAAERDEHLQASFRSWLPAVQRARRATFRSLVQRIRSPRRGYDVYRGCDGRTAVVRTSGARFDWYDEPNDRTARHRFRHRAALPIRSAHATGFGAGCVERYAFVYLLSDPRELETATRLAGEFLARADLAGEIDLIMMPVPVPDRR
jgi:hypothetical protein